MTTAKGTMLGYAPSVLIKPVEPKTTTTNLPADLPKPPPALSPEQLAQEAQALIATQPLPAGNPEQAKYMKMWSRQEYRDFSPAEAAAQAFLKVASPKKMEEVIDFGTGTGRGALNLALFGQVKVTMVDFAPNCLDPELQNALVTQSHMLKFVLADLEKPLNIGAKYGFCCDVMEHIPTDKVQTVLQNILRSAQHVFFQISCEPDGCGKLIGETLHLTVETPDQWRARLKDAGATIHWSAQGDDGKWVSFYVSAWNPVSELVARGGVNTIDTVMLGNIRSAIARNLKQARPYQLQEGVVTTILAGGWSLNDYWDEISEKYRQGQKVITVNGAYNEAVKRNILPSAQIVVDARPFNVRFVQPIVPTCKYLLASQCDPSVFDAVPADQIWLWHSPVSEALADVVERELQARNEVFYPIPGGSTVILRGLTLLRMLGLAKFEMYGFDSCLSESGRHHAYEQAEDSGQSIVKVTCTGDGRIFHCYPWMASQAQEFIDQLRHVLLDELDLIVHGDGLIAHILKTGANMALEQE